MFGIKRDHNKKPCDQCPFRRKAINGFLGDSTPEEFIGTTMADYPMPCHLSIDYSSPVWKESWEVGEEGRLCAGALIFYANISKMSRDPARPRLKPDRDNVFASPSEFLAHHTKSIEDVIADLRKKQADPSYQQKEANGTKKKPAARRSRSGA